MASRSTSALDITSWVLAESSDDERPILIDACDPTRSISHKEARRMVSRFVKAFEADSTVCLHLYNDILYPILFLSILGAGCRWTGSNTAYTAAELAHHFKISETRYVVTAPEHLQAVSEAVMTAGLEKCEILLFADVLRDPLGDSCVLEVSSGLRTLHDLLSKEEHQWLTITDETTAKETPAVLMSTSGTTGLPKMAVRSHQSLILESMAIADVPKKPYEVRRLFCTPVFHAFSAPMMLLNALRYRETTYVMKRFDDTFARRIRDYRITETAMPPPLFLRMLGASCEEKSMLRRLQLIWSGGAPLAEDIRLRFLVAVPNPRIVDVYGMTEAGWLTTFKYPENDDTGSVGRLLPDYSAKIIRETDQTVNEGCKYGEILVNGPGLMLGYYKNFEATIEAFDTEGWLKTGDLGYEKSGKLYVIDRKKELIKVKGWQVAPAELEAALLQYEGVLDTAVIGIKQDADEIPVAFIVRNSKNVTKEAVKAHLLQRLARYKVMHCEICFIDAIPRSASGKILKKILRAEHLTIT